MARLNCIYGPRVAWDCAYPATQAWHARGVYGQPAYSIVLKYKKKAEGRPGSKQSWA